MVAAFADYTIWAMSDDIDKSAGLTFAAVLMVFLTRCG